LPAAWSLSLSEAGISGGGGRGMRVANNAAELHEFFTTASREAEAALQRPLGVLGERKNRKMIEKLIRRVNK